MILRGKHRRRRGDESISRSSLWNLAAQLTNAALTIAVIPIIVVRLGVPAYGVYSLGLTSIVLIQQIDGGLINSSTRYIAVYRGSGDSHRITQLILTLSIILIVGGTAIATGISAASGHIVNLVDIPKILIPQSRLFFKLIAFLLPISLLQALATSVLQAHSRFRRLSLTSISTAISRAAAIFLFASGGHGLERMAIIQLIYQTVSWILIIPSALQYMHWEKSMLMGLRDLAELMRYSLNIQISNITALVNVQADAVIVALFLPIRDVALYTTGANLAIRNSRAPE